MGFEARIPATFEARTFRRVDDELPQSGSKPMAWLEDGSGQRWIFKASAPALAAAEELAFELRSLGGRPCVPARAVLLSPANGAAVAGVLKPALDFDPEDQLPTDTELWSELQRGVMLAEHAWEWLLDDLDANRSQYALLGDERHPVKLDWDRALSSAEPGPPSRFDRYKPLLPNARSFLYADWLEQRIDLDFALLRNEARHIARLPRERMRRALRRYAALAGLAATEADDVARAVLERQRRAPAEFDRFVRNLRRERAALEPGDAALLRPLLRAGGVRVWREWQLLLDGMIRGPAGDLGRSLLRNWRGRGVREV
jgi:hypothetical protein